MIATISQALKRGETAAALNAAQAFALENAQNPQAHYWLSICLQHNGDMVGARAAIDQAINLAPDRADFQISRAALALGEQDYFVAERAMKEATSLDPNPLQAYITLAHLALARGENEEASKQLKLAQKIHADHPQVLLLEGHLAQYRGQPDEALKFFTAAAELEPKNSLAQISLGMAYASRGMWQPAEQALKNGLALEPTNPGVMRGLVRSQMQQKKWSEVIDTLGQWLIHKPADRSVRMMRAQIRAQIGQWEETIEDLTIVNDATPANPQVLSPLVNALMTIGRPGEALEILEAALAINPNINSLWSMRTSLTSNQLPATQEVLQRWLKALPESPQVHEAIAQTHETTGELDAAETSADKALSLEQNLPYAQFIKLRAEIRNNPILALERLEKLERAASNLESQRMVYSWRGLTHDKLGQYEKAVVSFQQMVARPLAQYPLPQISPAQVNNNADIAGTLLWAPAGTRLEAVLQALQPLLGKRLLTDRNLPNARNDGFGQLRANPETQQAGTAKTWQSAIESRGLETDSIVDWIPHFDAYTASELKGTRIVALVSDPRDALINWMLFGSAQGYQFHPEETFSAEWLAQTFEAFAEYLEHNSGAASMVKIDDLPTHASSVAAALQTALGLTDIPDEKILGLKVRARGGFDNQFPAGHWRHYRDSYKAAFDRLTPVAVRLGYPAV